MKAEAPFIQIRELRKVYKMGENEVIALNSIDLHIARGSFTVVMDLQVPVKARCFIYWAVWIGQPAVV
jgi:hypothetical protein